MPQSIHTAPKLSFNVNSRLFPEALREKLTEQVFRRTFINPQTRPFDLSMEEFSDIASVYWDMCQQYEGLYEYNCRAPLKERMEIEWNDKVLTHQILAG